MKKLLTLIVILFTCSYGTAQIARYDLNTNLADPLNNHDASYIINGIPNASPNFSSASGADGVLLEPVQALHFPLSLIDAIDTTESMEIEFTYTLTDLGDGFGSKDLWSCSPGANETGFSLYIRHDDFSDEEDYEVIFSFSDGGLNQEVPNHIGHFEAVVGYFFLGDVVDVRLILDFENSTWTTIVGGTYNSSSFTAEFEFNETTLKESIKENEWYFGWHEGMDFDITFSPDEWSSTVFVDEFTTYSPKQPEDAGLLTTALQAMIAHADGSNLLSAAQREVFLSDILLNYGGNHDLVATEVFAFMDAYEENNPPVYEDRSNASFVSLEPETRLLVFLQQSVFDEEYTLGNVDELAGRVFEFSNLFPGPVAAGAVRVSSEIVEVNGTHTNDFAARAVDDLADAKRPLGYYAAPGEVVTIEIPANLVGAGLSIMIGAHDADRSSLTDVNRFNRMSKLYPLATTSTRIVSPFGGGLYLRVPLNSQLGYVPLTITDAVKSPYFSWRDGRETAPADWAAQLNASGAQWVDIESDKYLMTLPLAHVTGLTDPTSLITQWDAILDAYRFIGGRPNPRPRSEYFMVDSGLPDVAFGTGYPQIIGDNTAPFSPFEIAALYPTQVLNPDFWDSGLYITFHEMGHAVLHPTLVAETESIVHVPTVYIYNELYGLSFDEAFRYSSGERLTLNGAAMDWMITHNFRNNNDMGIDPTAEGQDFDEIRYQHRGFAKYVNMAQLLGWETVSNMNNVFYEEWTDNGVESFEVNKDNMLRSASEANGVNMAPMFHFWGHAPSAALKAELDVLPASAEIYNQLLAYYEIIPESQAEFLVWRNRLLEAKDGVHANRINAAFNNYESENYADDMREQICGLIEIYFPTSPPCGLNTLPVTFLDFSVREKKNETAVLNWTTATEVQNAGFYVERSLGGWSWIELGFVVGNGTSNEQQSYQFEDAGLIPETYYYRLRQVDLGGAFVYSPIRNITITAGANPFGIRVFPNPVNEAGLTVALSDVEDVAGSASVVDLLGRTLSQQSFSSSTFVVPTRDLPRGAYWLIVEVNGKAGREKFFVN